MKVRFDEVGLNTVNPVYQLTHPDVEVQFLGKVVRDGASLTSPILAGKSGDFQQDTFFILNRPMKFVEFDVGTLQNKGGVVVRAFNRNGDEVYSRATENTGPNLRETVTIDLRDFEDRMMSVSRVWIDIQNFEQDGAGIDNVGVSGPATLRPPALSNAGSGEVQISRGDLGVLNKTDPGTVLARGEMSVNSGKNPEEILYTFSTAGKGNASKLTFEIYDARYPDDTRVFTKTYQPGTHRISIIEDEKSGDFAGNFVLMLKKVDGRKIAPDSTIYKLSEIFDGLGVSLVSLLNDLDDQQVKSGKAIEKKLSKHLGKAAFVLDVGFRAAQVAEAEDTNRELFVQIVDGLLSFGLLGGLSLINPVLGFGSALVYNFGASSKVKEWAREIYDEFSELEEVSQRAFSAQERSIANAPTLQDLMDQVAAANPPEFDETFYLEQNPDVAGMIRSGEISSAYAHFVAKGVFQGLATHQGQTELPKPRDIVDAGAAADTGLREQALLPLTNPDDTLSPAFAGDGASAPERQLMALIEDTFDIPEWFNLDVDLMWRLANRKAWDIVHNHPEEALADLLAGEAQSTLFSNGQTAEELFGRFQFRADNLSFHLVAPEAGTPEAALAALSADFGFGSELRPARVGSIGVAEYGGVWVVALADEFSLQNRGPVADEDASARAVRHGSDGRDMFDLGTWTGSLFGAGGDDHLISGVAGGSLLGGSGNDFLIGRDGRDHLSGGAGADNIQAGGGRDKIKAGSGNDTVLGEAGRDTVLAGRGKDKASGGDEGDVIRLGGGNDQGIGDKGDDILDGGAGRDRLKGGAGNDLFFGGKGRDVLTGGADSDRFLFATGFGTDTVVDFEDGVDEIVFVRGDLAGKRSQIIAAATEDTGGLVLRFGSNVLTIDDMTLEGFDLSDVRFATEEELSALGL